MIRIDNIPGIYTSGVFHQDGDELIIEGTNTLGRVLIESPDTIPYKIREVKGDLMYNKNISSCFCKGAKISKWSYFDSGRIGNVFIDTIETSIDCKDLSGVQFCTINNLIVRGVVHGTPFKNSIKNLVVPEDISKTWLEIVKQNNTIENIEFHKGMGKFMTFKELIELFEADKAPIELVIRTIRSTKELRHLIEDYFKLMLAVDISRECQFDEELWLQHGLCVDHLRDGYFIYTIWNDDQVEIEVYKDNYFDNQLIIDVIHNLIWEANVIVQI